MGAIQIVVLLTVLTPLVWWMVYTIIKSGRAMAEANRAYLAGAISSVDLTPGVNAAVSFRPVPGQPHTLWLDLDVKAPGEPTFSLFLALRLGQTIIVNQPFGLSIDDEGDMRGLPKQLGAVALDTAYSSALGAVSICCVQRLYRFEVPPGSPDGELQARLDPAAGTAFSRARLLVIPGERKI